MVTIYPTGGLCNYLRVVFSYHEYAKSISSTLTVIWIKTDACPGYFLDYFEPIPTIQFITNHNTNDEAFVEFIEKAGMHKLIYIATDNKATYDAFKKKYADRIKLEYHQTNQNGLRETSLQDSIIDIYICVYTLILSWEVDGLVFLISFINYE